MIGSQSRHSARAVPTKRSAIAFVFGARTGGLMVSIPSFAKRGELADRRSAGQRFRADLPGKASLVSANPSRGSELVHAAEGTTVVTAVR